MPKISIIIPVYNTESYLRRCLDSVCGQTLHDIEIVCINDASTDNSPKILHEYASRDSRILIVNNDANIGETASRNKGLYHVKGEYLGFVDSDDYIDADFCKKLYMCAMSNRSDIVKCRVKTLQAGIFSQSFGFHEKIFLNKHYFYEEFTSAIYRSSLLREHNIVFRAGSPYGGDLVFLIHAIARASKVSVIDDTFYIYCRRDGSASTYILGLDKIQSVLACAHAIVDILNNVQVEPEGYAIVFNRRMEFLLSLPRRAAKKERKPIARLLATELIQLYAKCAYKELFTTNDQYFHTLLLEDNVNSMASYFIRFPAAGLAATLRVKAKNSMESEKPKSAQIQTRAIL